MDHLRSSPPQRVADDDVVAVADYQRQVRKERTGRSTPVRLPASNVLTFELASGSRIIARPSGTEPKAKFYFDAIQAVRSGESVKDAMVRANAMVEHLSTAFVAIANAAEAKGAPST
jgi:phosphomannomutase